jgi:transposase
MADAFALPDDIEALKRLVLAREAELAQAKADLVQAKARETGAEAVILNLRLAIEKLRRELYGRRSERSARLLEQMEFELEELEATAAEDDLLAELTQSRLASATSSPRRRPSRQPFPEHLPRERVVVPGPTTCACCGGTRLSKLGEDVTETLEVIPRSWKVIQTVRERFSCRDCETIA